jgi:hypothetical protein
LSVNEATALAGVLGIDIIHGVVIGEGLHMTGFSFKFSVFRALNISTVMMSLWYKEPCQISL